MDKILTKFRQTILLLDPNILLTKLGQNVDIFLSKFCQIYKNQPSGKYSMEQKKLYPQASYVKYVPIKLETETL